MHHEKRPGSGLAHDENTTGTIADRTGAVTAEAAACRDGRGQGRRCGFVTVAGWSYGAAAPFCDAPAMPGSSYCAGHRALCVVAPDSTAGAEASAALVAAGEVAPPPPPELSFLDPLAVPEPDAEPEPGELAGLFDLPARDAGVGGE